MAKFLIELTEPPEEKKKEEEPKAESRGLGWWFGRFLIGLVIGFVVGVGILPVWFWPQWWFLLWNHPC